MKKIILFSTLLLTSIIGNAQNTYPTATNTTTGLGTGSVTLPISTTLRLKVTSGTEGNTGIQLTNVTSATTTTIGNNKALSVDVYGNIILTPVANSNLFLNDGVLSANRNVTMSSKNLTFTPYNNNSQFFINGISGNVGIGSITPVAKLDITGGPSNGVTFRNETERFNNSLIINAGSLLNGTSIYRNFKLFDFPQSNFDAKPTIWMGIEDRNDYGRYRFIAETGGSTQMMILDKGQNEVMKIVDDSNNNSILSLPKTNSYLCIGTTNYIDGTDVYNLSVKGKIRAEEIKVYNTWADYVFNKNYTLKSLDEVENFINTNGHLPNVPSAKEIEEKGLKLGQMTKIQQEKIEELTLYLIKQNKEIEVLKGQVQKLLDAKQ